MIPFNPQMLAMLAQRRSNDVARQTPTPNMMPPQQMAGQAMPPAAGGNRMAAIAALRARIRGF